MRRIDKIILHCSATDYKNQTAAWIDKIHRARGFDMIGYTYFIRFSGMIEQGRFLEEVGAHAPPFNETSIGICLAGEYKFKPVQFKSLFLLLSCFKLSFPTATIHAHNEINKNKTCPNFSVEKMRSAWNWKTRNSFKFNSIKKVQGIGGREYRLAPRKLRSNKG